MTAPGYPARALELPAAYRPRNPAEIFDASARLYRAHFPLLLGISAVVTLPPIALAVLVPPLAGAAGVLSNVLISLGQGATTAAVTALLAERPIGVGESYRQLSGRAGTLIGLSILIGVLGILGFFLFVIPGAIVFVRTAVAHPAAVVERLSVSDAMTRSIHLTRGIWTHVLWTMLLSIVVVFGAAMGGGAALDWLVSAITGTVREDALMYDILFVVLFPLLAVAATLLYVDLRVRREGADLEALAVALPSATPGSALPPREAAAPSER